MKRILIFTLSAALLFTACDKKAETSDKKENLEDKANKAKKPNRYGGFSQRIDAKELGNTEIRMQAWAMAEVNANNTFQFWLRVDSIEGNKPLFFDNMDNRPITEATWKKYSIQGKIGENPKNIAFGGILIGEGVAWVDEIKIQFRKAGEDWQDLAVLNPCFEKTTNDSIAENWGTWGTGYLFKVQKEIKNQGEKAFELTGIPRPKAEYKVLAKKERKEIKLPEPVINGSMSIEETMAQRRSVRSYMHKAFDLQNVSQMLWAAYGVSDSIKYPNYKLKTAPSAGALYPLEIYLVANNVNGLEQGVYRYIPNENKLIQEIAGNVSYDLTDASWGQTMVEEAPIDIVWTAVFERCTKKYGERGRERYVCMDLGHSGQNVYLQATALGMGTCAIGAFDDEGISEVLNLPEEEEPLYIMPVGWLIK